MAYINITGLMRDPTKAARQRFRLEHSNPGRFLLSETAMVLHPCADLAFSS